MIMTDKDDLRFLVRVVTEESKIYAYYFLLCRFNVQHVMPRLWFVCVKFY